MDIKVDRDVLYFDTNKNNNDTLQVNDEAPLDKTTNRNRGCPYRLFCTGSLTVEAAFSGTIFFLALFSLLYLFQILERYNKVQMQLATVVQEYECFGTKRRVIRGENNQYFAVGWDEKQGICYVKHQEKIPCLGSSLFHISWYQQMKINSYEGRSMVSQGGEQGTYVYLAEYGKVYHRNKGCVYLNPDIQQVAYCQVEAKRNVSGGKYDFCNRCGKGSAPTETSMVYITPYGDSWHLDKKCSGLKRTIRKVLIEEIGGLPPCSKCGGL